MARKSLRAQLNQIRAWVRQGRTDAWIAHQLEVSAAELREFRRRHELAPDDDENAEIDLRDEIEAEIEAATLAAEEEEAELDEEDEEDEEPEDEGGELDAAPGREAEEAALVGDIDVEGLGEEADGGDDEAAAEAPADEGSEGQDAADGGEKKRRRRRRGGRGRGRGRAKGPLEATFDHGEKDGYGLWLDPAVTDNPNYAEHWAGHRAVEVEITPEQIVIRRSGSK